MYDKAREHVELELAQLRRLVEEHRGLLEECVRRPPTGASLSALANMLHSFYTGIERIFRRIAKEIDGDLPGGPGSHQQLLSRMADPTAARPAVISSATYDTLRDYLGYRHFFRQAYSFQYHWHRMADLVLRCAETLQGLEAELRRFFNGSC